VDAVLEGAVVVALELAGSGAVAVTEQPGAHLKVQFGQRRRQWVCCIGSVDLVTDGEVGVGDGAGVGVR
jgi:hypothetical protein